MLKILGINKVSIDLRKYRSVSTYAHLYNHSISFARECIIYSTVFIPDWLKNLRVGNKRIKKSNARSPDQLSSDRARKTIRGNRQLKGETYLEHSDTPTVHPWQKPWLFGEAERALAGFVSNTRARPLPFSSLHRRNISHLFATSAYVHFRPTTLFPDGIDCSARARAQRTARRRK